MDQLKQGMQEPPILIPPDFSKPFLVVTDASDFAIGGAILQVSNGKEHPIRYWSRTLQPAERNYHTTEKEALAVVQCLKQFRNYILGSKTILFTDHQALKQVLTNPRPMGRIARWVSTIQEYDFEIRHRPGAKNQLADSLSRDPGLRAVWIDVSKDPDADDILIDIKKYLEGDGQIAHVPMGRTRKILKLAARMFLREGELYTRRMNGNPVRVIISRAARKRAVTEIHDGLAHFGEKTSYELLANTCWWPGQRLDVLEYIRTCKVCQTHAKLQRPEKPMTIPVENVFERFALDYVGPLPRTHNGNRYIIVATEALTRWPIAKAVPEADAKTTAKFLYDEIVLQFGPPETILTDQGTHFINKLIEQVTEHLQTKHLRTTPYHPQTNGMTERFNGTLCKALSKLANYSEDDWDKFIPTVLFSYRIRKHTTLGTSPYEALYGVPPKLPNGEILGQRTPEEDRLPTLKEIQDNAKRPPMQKESRFKEGQSVLWKSGVRRNKMEPNLYGPFTIQSCGPNNTYILIDNNDEEVPILISGDRLQLYKDRIRGTGRRTVVPRLLA